MRRRFLLLSLCVPAWALAEPVHIPGPQGSLEAEAIVVEDAAHAVVIVPGSGPTDRDGNARPLGLASDTYRLLAEGLAGHGIASLRIDKRGFYGSATAIADPNDVTIAHYAEDVRGWVGFATGLAPCVWIAGHSEGGLVALVAAEASPEGLCGLILMATSGRPTGQLMIEQLRSNPANASLMPEIESIVADLENGQSRDGAAITPILQPLFSEGLQRYMIDLFSHDPGSIARNWRGPVLIIQGDEDIQVRPHDADLLEAAMPQAERVDLPGGTHMLKAGVAGQPFATYTDPSHPLHGDVVPAIVDFLSRATTAQR